MRILLIAFGSIGDVNPLVGIGIALRERGLHPFILANPYFAPLILAARLEPVGVGTIDEYQELLHHPDLWHPRKGLVLLFRHALSLMRQTYERIADLHKPATTVLGAPRIALAARLAEESLEVPLATLVINPLLLRSAHSPPHWPGVRAAGGLGPWAARALFWQVDREYDRLLKAPLNAVRAEIGLAPLGRVSPWLISPQRVIGLWPDWLYGPQADQPEQARLTGFIEHDGEVGETAIAPLSDHGEAPIVVSAGTAQAQSHVFFANATTACERLKYSGILITQYAEQIQARLPPGVRHVPYAPLATLLPHARAIVHHGGIGTSARALAAGIPQLVAPLAYDQFDNAQRLQRLGVAAVLAPTARSADDIAAGALGRLLASYMPRLTLRHIMQRMVETRLWPFHAAEASWSSKASHWSRGNITDSASE